MTCGPRTDRSSAHENVRLIDFARFSQKPVYRLSIFENLLCSLLRFIPWDRLGIVLLVNTVARILHTNDVDLQLLDHLLHQWLSQSDILSVGVKMNEHLFALSLEIETWHKVLGLVAWCLFFESYQLLLFIDLLPLVLFLLELLWLQLLDRILCRFALHWYRTFLHIERVWAWDRSYLRFSKTWFSVTQPLWSVNRGLISWWIRFVQFSGKHHLSWYWVEVLRSLWNPDSTFSLITFLIQILQRFQILCLHQVHSFLILPFGWYWHLILNISRKPWRFPILQYSISLLHQIRMMFVRVHASLPVSVLSAIPPLYGIEIIKPHITAQLRQSRQTVLDFLLDDIRKELFGHASRRHQLWIHTDRSSLVQSTALWYFSFIIVQRLLDWTDCKIALGWLFRRIGLCCLKSICVDIWWIYEFSLGHLHILLRTSLICVLLMRWKWSAHQVSWRLDHSSIVEK